MKNSSSEKLKSFLSVEKQAQNSASIDEFSFIAANLSKKFFDYNQSIFWTIDINEKIHINSVSGTAGFDTDSPYIVWATKLIKQINKDFNKETYQLIDAETLNEKTQKQWSQWLPRYAYWCAFKKNSKNNAGLIFFSKQEWDEKEIETIKSATESYNFIYQALLQKYKKSKSKFINFKKNKVRKIIAAALLLSIFLLPVRQAILAPAEIVAQSPIIVTAPLNGVIKEILVEPNQAVKKGDLLFTFDDTELKNRYETAKKELNVTVERLRKASQHAFQSEESKSQIEILKAEVEIKHIEEKFVRELLQRVEVRAAIDGLIIFSKKNDWIGKPVVIGEKVMQLANPSQKELDIWLPTSDAIILNPGSEIKLYVHAYPLKPINAELIFASHNATSRPDGTFSYHLKAEFLEDKEFSRIGLQGTAKIFGDHVTLFYYLMRRPIGIIRQTFGI